MASVAQVGFNLSRTLRFALVLLVVRTGAGFIEAGLPVQLNASENLLLHYAMTYLIDAVLVIAVFTRLAMVQVQSPYVHAAAVVVVQELLGMGLLLVLGASNPESPLWLLDWGVLLVSTVVGVELGRRLRSNKK